MAGTPILPSDPRDPTGVDPLERKAMRDYARRLRRIGREYVAAIGRFPSELVVNAKYAYQLDSTLVNAILAQLDFFVDREMLEGGAERPWLFEEYASVAYQRGTAKEYANLARQSGGYRGHYENLAQLLRSDQYRRRLVLVRARVFEEMKGLSGTIKADMTRVLTDGMARGQGPLEIARRLKEQTDIEEGRADRIARTEITTALRRARLDEADDAADRLGLRTLQMHLSALSPTTRRSHAERHGKLFTTEQQRDWMSSDGNSINCKCSTAAVMVDSDGDPLVPKVVERARAAYRKMAAGDAPWAED